MYEGYLTVGVCLSALGLAMIVYWVWYVKKRAYKQPIILSISQAVGLMIIGSFYAYSAITMSHKLNSTDYTHLTNETSMQETYFEITELNNSSVDKNGEAKISYMQESNSEAPQPLNSSEAANQFLLRYQQLIKNVLSNRSSSQRQLKVSNNDTCSSYYDILLQDAMLVYSFVHSLITVINSSIECKNCKDDSTIPEETKTRTSKSTAINNRNNNNKLVMKLLMLLLIPPLTASSLYFTKTNQEAPSASQGYLKSIIQTPLNVSTPTNKTQVDSIVQNVYRIVKQAKINPLPYIPLQRNREPQHEVCYAPNIYLKLHTFIVFIIGYFAVLLYSQASYPSPAKADNYPQGKNLKVSAFGFGALWLPSALDMFTRVYLTGTSPGRVTELLSVLGNCNHILASISRVLMEKDVVKSESRVRPVEE